MISSTVHFPSSTKIFVARFGNMYDSSGSLVSHWKENPHKIQGLSHPDLTRYFFSKEDAARFVLSVVDSARHGEIHIPRMKSARIADIMAMLNVQATQRIHGLQRGEKIHEDLLGPEELAYTSLQEDRYIVHPDAIERSELDPSALSELSSSTSLRFTEDEIRKVLIEL